MKLFTLSSTIADIRFLFSIPVIKAVNYIKLRTAIMDHVTLVISQLAVIITLLFSTAASGQESKSASCKTCHKDTYLKAISFKYQHSITKDQCHTCHISSEEEDNIRAQMNFPVLQREWLINLDQLSDNQDYQADVILTDSTGKSCTPSRIDITPKDTWEPDGQHPSFKLTKLSGVIVEEIKRRGFIGATISWETNAFATTEVEYRTGGARADTYKIDDLYTKSHNIILHGLKYKSNYSCRVVSRDIYGNILKSEEFTFNTSEEFTRTATIKGDASALPVIEHMQVFRKPDGKGLFLKVSANRPSGISVTVKEVRNKDSKHGFGLMPAQYSRIDVCYKCHPHDSSHPVGVRAESPKIRTPKDLPTIDGGIITCVTCHTPHGGDRVFFNRFDFRKDLCMRCHLEKYDNL